MDETFTLADALQNGVRFLRREHPRMKGTVAEIAEHYSRIAERKGNEKALAYWKLVAQSCS